MILKSLINLTDLLFHEFDGVVINHGNYISIETPNNPNYFWGNYLIFLNPPRPGDFSVWRQRFKERFGNKIDVKHELYAWEGTGPTDLDDFLKAGFTLESAVTMTAQNISKPKKWNDEIMVRPFNSQKDWNESLEMHLLMHEKEYGKESYRSYRIAKDRRYQKMIAMGLGQWFGAFLNGKLVGDLGIFKKNSLGRFQLVSTHPDFQRQGICSTLLYKVSEVALEEMGIKTLVIAADEDYFAKNIYSSIGMAVVEKNLGVVLRPSRAKLPQ